MLWSGEPTLNLTIYFQRGGSELHYDACFPKTVLPRRGGRVSTIEGNTTMQKYRIAYFPLWKIGLCLL